MFGLPALLILRHQQHVTDRQTDRHTVGEGDRNLMRFRHSQFYDDELLHGSHVIKRPLAVRL